MRVGYFISPQPRLVSSGFHFFALLVGQPEELAHLLLVGGPTMGRRRYQRITERHHG